MSTEKRNVFRFFLVFIIALALILINFVLKKHLLYSQNTSVSKIENIKSRLREKENLANRGLNEIIAVSKNHAPSIFFGDDKLSNLYKKEKISFFIYNKDSLSYWSNNSVPLNNLQTNNFFDSTFVNLSNGWYEIIKRRINDQVFLATILIKSEYKYENDYLLNEFNQDFGISSQNAKISISGKSNIIRNLEGKPLFSITYKQTNSLNNSSETLIFFIYLIAFLALLYLIYLLCEIIFRNTSSETIKKLTFLFLLIVFRALLFYFKLPSDLYSLELFSPIYFASSELLPSLGDLLLNTILFFVISVIILKTTIINNQKSIGKQLSIYLSFLLLFLSGLLFCFVIDLLQSIIIDSTISYNLNQLFSINGLSILGFFIISFTILSFLLINITILNILYRFSIRIIPFFIGLLLAVLLIILIHPFKSSLDFQLLLGFSFFNSVYYFLRLKKGPKIHFYEILFYLIVFTYFTYYTLNDCNKYKEIEKRKSFAQKLSSGQDPLAEYIYRSTQKIILADNFIKKKLRKYTLKDNETSEYIIKNYFSGYWDKYKVQITICNNNDSLLIEPSLVKRNCYMYFDDLIKSIGKPSSCENLYVLNDGSGGNNYISQLEFSDDSSSMSLFIELNSKFIPKGLGYPELLIDKKIFINTDLSDYSYAKYLKNTLIDAYGKYYYSSDFYLKDSLNTNDTYIFSKNGFNHLVYKIDDSSFLIISKKNGNLLDTLSPFSMLFTLFCITLFLFFLINNFPVPVKLFRFDFKNRLQVSMVSIIFVSFIVIGVSTYYFIRNLDENKNVDILSEKAMSILIELQDKLSVTETLNLEQQTVLSNSLAKLSNIFFTDINIFDNHGNIVSSSRPQIFNEGLISDKMNTLAYQQMITEKTTLFIQKENIGKLKYYSAYVPFYNSDGKVMYYINLPYFAKESELKKELSSFLIAFINIYVLLIVITVLVTLFVAGRISRPLNTIREKMSKIKLGSKNEKIFWPRRDEIGSLISEYNRMVDELSNSAELLARSERESAWREMAMQVAHEIKNPLTPMKLSVQYLDKAWKDKAPDWDIRLERFTKNIVEQIDSLSVIASEFSYFAKMPIPKKEIINLVDVVKNSVEIFRSNSNIKISLEYDKLIPVRIFADKKQIIRVMNNLLNNAVQAIGTKNIGNISVEIEIKETKTILIIKDDGEGISDEMKDKIFIPNFSTKSEGMGLGLAIVSSIIETYDGKIWFESEKGSGTSFYVELPLYKNE